MRQRIIVCPLIQNQGAFLLCKMPADRGVFPGQWALSGGGLEPGERLEEGLRREIREELGERLHIAAIKPWSFRDDIRTKTYADGSTEQLHMIYLIFDCEAGNRDVTLNDEFVDHAWVEPERLQDYDLNVATLQTFLEKGVLTAV
ncbi:nucleoside triphosphatase NudI [Mesorhizobium sp. Pch-S]|uniref:nucleoside triphosphatase NudI n=1 Tax=Mesorhizobium sp. Pch-S TaxID=2082387 RepID=UPI001010226B|nr:nucleoside triphosphatase NudI [Mesorhizobium sp. Pch-S]QAZ42826.1 nucleoside triphosphatase NudI [Mesorhizobium sp. Pch-S]